MIVDTVPPLWTVRRRRSRTTCEKSARRLAARSVQKRLTMNDTHASALDSVELLTLTLTLRGHSLKQVAIELQVSNALACRIRRDALNKVGAENVCQFVIGCASGAISGFERPTLGTEGLVLEMTQAEYDVARQVVQGLSNATIAARRGTAQRTVANQLASLYRKLKVQSRLELALVMSGARHL